MNTITVNSGVYKIGYPLFMERGALRHAGEYIKRLNPSGIFIITNHCVFDLYGEILTTSLKESGFSPSVIFMGDGEKYKNTEEIVKICRQLVSEGVDRKSLVIPFGGGVTGDLGGFAASTVMRGVPFVHIPTTLVSQVDSSIGGKLGVNLPEGKNLWGIFQHPQMVITDPEVLYSLPTREFSCGMAEVIKSAMISSPKLLDMLEKCPDKLQEIDGNFLKDIVLETAKIKVKIVSEDVYEKGTRMKLNLGHTVGHGIEKATNYLKYNHGEAVSIGLAAALAISRKLFILKEETFEARILRLLKKFRLPAKYSEIEAKTILNAIQFDKKKTSDVLRFILPVEAGRVDTVDIEDSGLILEVLKELKN